MSGTLQAAGPEHSIVRPRTIQERALLSARAAAYVSERLSEPLVLEDCARALYTSPRQLQRALADQGTSWRRLVLESRMREAAERLADRHWPIGRVGHSVGYLEPGQFAKAFRRAYGMTPTQYRARARDGHGE